MKKIKGILVLLALLSPAATMAGGTQIGTAPLLLGLGIGNIYGQFQLGKTTAITAAYSTISGSYGGGNLQASTYAVTYKSYFSEYANGGYWQAGAAALNVTSSTVSSITGDAIIPILVAGYEKTFGGGFVLGAEGGLGTGHGWGFIGVNAAYQF